MTDKVYDVLKDISLCWMPLGIAFIGVVMETTGVSYAGSVMTILVAANTFLGGVVKYYKAQYDKEDK